MYLKIDCVKKALIRNMAFENTVAVVGAGVEEMDRKGEVVFID